MTSRDLAVCALFAAITAVSAQLSITLPWITSVPFTLQVFAVILTGLVLGASRGFVSQLLYLLLGAVGLPVFAQLRGGLSVLVGPTAGYLWAFPLAALVAGWVTGGRQRPQISGWRLAAGGLLALVPVYALGAWWLAASGAVPGLGRAFQVGVLPFVVPDAVKALLAAGVAARVRRALAAGALGPRNLSTESSG